MSDIIAEYDAMLCMRAPARRKVDAKATQQQQLKLDVAADESRRRKSGSDASPKVAPKKAPRETPKESASDEAKENLDGSAKETGDDSETETESKATSETETVLGQ